MNRVTKNLILPLLLMVAGCVTAPKMIQWGEQHAVGKVKVELIEDRRVPIQQGTIEQPMKTDASGAFGPMLLNVATVTGGHKARFELRGETCKPGVDYVWGKKALERL